MSCRAGAERRASKAREPELLKQHAGEVLSTDIQLLEPLGDPREGIECPARRAQDTPLN
jgi:hypothetical protein